MAPRVAVATTWTAVTLIPVRMTGDASGISIVVRMRRSVTPMPRAASTISGSTVRTPVWVLVNIGGRARKNSATKVGRKPRPLSMNPTLRARRIVSGRAMAMIPNEGSARPMLTTAVTATPPRPVWPSHAPRGRATAAAANREVADTHTCSQSRIGMPSGPLRWSPNHAIRSPRNSISPPPPGAGPTGSALSRPVPGPHR